MIREHSKKRLIKKLSRQINTPPLPFTGSGLRNLPYQACYGCFCLTMPDQYQREKRKTSLSFCQIFCPSGCPDGAQRSEAARSKLLMELLPTTSHSRNSAISPPALPCSPPPWPMWSCQPPTLVWRWSPCWRGTSQAGASTKVSYAAPSLGGCALHLLLD